MKTFLANSVDNLINGNDIIETYESLAKLFDETGMYQEEAGILEKIYNLTNDCSYFISIGDIFAQKMENYDFAQKLYEIYLSKAHPKFYEKYSYVLDKLGMSGHNPNEIEEIKTEANYLADRYVAGIYILVLLNQRKEYDTILECAEKLKIFEMEINSKYKDNTDCLNDIIDAKNFLAGELANVKHHNDLNGLAMYLNPDYEVPYLNIIDDLLTYENYSDALSFYNNIYAVKFDHSQKDSSIDLCWFMSDRYNAYGQAFDAVRFQQKAIELELSTKEEN